MAAKPKAWITATLISVIAAANLATAAIALGAPLPFGHLFGGLFIVIIWLAYGVRRGADEVAARVHVALVQYEEDRVRAWSEATREAVRDGVIPRAVPSDWPGRRH